jgi:hypothetical protein
VKSNNLGTALNPHIMSRMPRSSRKRCHRGGYTLMIVVLLLFGFLALAALVIDIGMARVAQRQMQTAVDAAALEDARYLDVDETEIPSSERRRRAAEMAAWVFDDDLNPADDERMFGAGAVYDLSGGVGDPVLNAGQTLALGDPPIYKPRRADTFAGLELNEDNEPHGDLVEGTYHPTASHGEAADYTRDDFDPSAARSAALARMRRTNDFDGLDQAPGVSSSGPAMPLLFGRGALLNAADPAAGYSPRHHGISVRATAIASGRPAMTTSRSKAPLLSP